MDVTERKMGGNVAADLIVQLQALEHIHNCAVCQQEKMALGTSHFVIWAHDEDYVTCLRLRDNRFLTFAEYRAYIPEIVRTMKKEEHSA